MANELKRVSLHYDPTEKRTEACYEAGIFGTCVSKDGDLRFDENKLAMLDKMAKITFDFWQANRMDRALNNSAGANDQGLPTR